MAHLARRAADYGVDTGEVGVDMAAVRRRKRSIVDDWVAGSRKGLEGTEFLDKTSVMELGEAPEHLVVLGGGYGGLEFALDDSAGLSRKLFAEAQALIQVDTGGWGRINLVLEVPTPMDGGVSDGRPQIEARLRIECNIDDALEE